MQRKKLYQKNKSTMFLKTNGHVFSRIRTKHINARYFMVADRVTNAEVKVELCLAKYTWADVLNSPGKVCRTGYSGVN